MWIELHDTLPDHPKILRAAKLLKVSRNEIMGGLTALWLWAAQNREDGILDDLDADRLNIYTGISAKSEKILLAFISVGLLENASENRYSIHDWYDYVGTLMDRRERNRQQTKERVKRYRSKKMDEDVTQCNALHERYSNAECNANCNADVTLCNGTTVPNRTIPYLTVPEGRKEATAISSLSVCSAKTYSEVRDALSEYLHRDIEDWEVAKARELFRRHSDELVWRAISEACLHNANKPIFYAAGALSDWDANDIASIDELEKWRMANGFD